MAVGRQRGNSHNLGLCTCRQLQPNTMPTHTLHSQQSAGCMPWAAFPTHRSYLEAAARLCALLRHRRAHACTVPRAQYVSKVLRRAPAHAPQAAGLLPAQTARVPQQLGAQCHSPRPPGAYFTLLPLSRRRPTCGAADRGVTPPFASRPQRRSKHAYWWLQSSTSPGTPPPLPASGPSCSCRPGCHPAHPPIHPPSKRTRCQ